MDYTLYNKLTKISQNGRRRFHMPGHKGKPMGTLLDGAFSIDLTEIPSTGNLNSDEYDIIKEAEIKTALYYGAEACVFLTCGATQGIKAALALMCGESGEFLCDRNTHRSVTDASVLLNLTPRYISPRFDAEMGITKDFDMVELAETLDKNPNIKTFIVTSPTYYGYCHDIASICSVCSARGVKVIVDGAHGAHLKAFSVKDPVSEGADAVIFSAHKTLCTLTQGAYLLLKDKTLQSQARELTFLFGTSSPSYPIMASLDMGRETAEKLGAERAESLISTVSEVRRRLSSVGYRCDFLGDPMRITVNIGVFNTSGEKLSDLFREHGIEPEMQDDRNVVFIAAFADSEEDLLYIAKAGEKIAQSLEKSPRPPLCALPPLLERVMPPRKAFFAEKRRIPLKNAVGEVLAESLYIYPPGVPIGGMGEIIDKKLLEYLHEISYNIDKEIKIVSH